MTATHIFIDQASAMRFPRVGTSGLSVIAMSCAGLLVSFLAMALGLDLGAVLATIG